VPKEILPHKVYAPIELRKVRDVFFGPPGILGTDSLDKHIRVPNTEHDMPILSGKCEIKNGFKSDFTAQK